MENRQQEILSEIKEMMASIRAQLELLDTKMAELQYEVDPQVLTVDSIDLDLEEAPIDDDLPFYDEPVADEPTVDEPVVDEPIDDEPVAEEPVVDEQVVEVLVSEEQVSDLLQQQVEEDMPEALIPEPAIVDIQIEKPAVIDVMTARQAWRTDMPGAPVRDVRSAISLNDRVLFINVLFDEDPMAFQDTLTVVNQMNTVDEVVAYLASNRPAWDMNSETVYRFMMAVRRKLN